MLVGIFLSLLVFTPLQAKGNEISYPPKYPFTVDVSVKTCEGEPLPDKFELEFDSGLVFHFTTDENGDFHEILAVPYSAHTWRITSRGLITDWQTSTEAIADFNICFQHLPFIKKG